MTKKKIIACQIFTDELLAVLPEENKDIDINWIDAGLHANIDKLEITLEQSLKDSVEQGSDEIDVRQDLGRYDRIFGA